MTSPLVSILVPAYNAERFIAQTLRSAVEQTWPRKEILVVDDGSTDRTCEVARGFAENGVKVVRQENAGACATRNALFSQAQGDYIQWLDADDILASDKIEKQLSRREGEGESEVLLTSACASFFFRTQRCTWQRSGLWQDLSPVEWMTTKFVENAWMNPTVWLVSRHLAEAAGPWDVRLTAGDDDGEYIHRVVAAARDVRFVRDAVCFYRIGVNGTLTDGRQLEAMCLSLELSFQRFLELADTPETRAACLAYLTKWSKEFYGADDVIFDRVRALAQTLGGSIDRPDAPKKYRLIEHLAGPARTADLFRRWRKFKLLAQGSVDRVLWNFS